MEVIDLESIIRRHLSGDQAAFEEVYNLLIDRVYSYIYSRVDSATEAKDLTQDTFVDLYKALKKFEFRSSAQFYSLVFVITKKKLARYYNSRRFAKESQIDEYDAKDFSFDDREMSETNDVVRRALEKIPDIAREIIVLHHWSRYTFGEIATFFGMKESAVRVRHHRALKELASFINKN